MSAHVMKPGRKSSITDPIAVTSASCDELRQIAGGCVGYYGTFSIDEESKTVIHHVECCTLPAWIGTDQTRHYEFVDTHLALRAGSGKAVGNACRIERRPPEFEATGNGAEFW